MDIVKLHIVAERLETTKDGTRFCSFVSQEPVFTYLRCKKRNPRKPHIFTDGGLATAREILLSLFSTVVVTAFILHHEQLVTPPGYSHFPVLALDPGHFSFLLDPSPGVMLFFSLVLGCSISSFAYRRQSQDRYQAFIFMIAITGAIAFGLGTGVSANCIMLGLIPGALCSAIVFSTGFHFLVRRCRRRNPAIGFRLYEKQDLLPK